VRQRRRSAREQQRETATISCAVPVLSIVSSVSFLVASKSLRNDSSRLQRIDAADGQLADVVDVKLFGLHDIRRGRLERRFVTSSAFLTGAIKARAASEISDFSSAAISCAPSRRLP